MKKLLFPLTATLGILLIIYLIGIYPATEYWNNSKEGYFSGPIKIELPMISFFELLEEVSEDSRITDLEELIDLLNQLEKKLPVDYKSDPIAVEDQDKWNKVLELCSVLQSFSFDDLDGWKDTQSTFKVTMFKKAKFQRYIKLLSRQIIKSKKQDKSKDFSSVLAFLWKIPVIVDKASISLRGKSQSNYYLEDIVELTHTLYIRNALLLSEINAISLEMTNFLNENESIDLQNELDKTERILFSTGVKYMEDTYPLVALYNNVFSGDPQKAYDKYLSKKDFITNDISQKDFKSLPFLALKGFPPVRSTQLGIVRSRLYISLLQCQFGLEYYYDTNEFLDYKMENVVKDGIKNCEIKDSGFLNGSNSEPRTIKLNALKY